MKACDGCNLCCKVLHVESLAKPPGRLCRHAMGGAGCAIHGDHPADCRAFACGWLQWADLGDAWKPSTAHFLIRSEPSQGRLCIDVDPDHPQAWKQPAYYPTIKAWSASVREKTGCVLVYVGEGATVVFPEEDLAIGRLGPEERLLVGYARGKTWERPIVRLLRSGETTREWLGAKRPRAA